MARYYVSFSGRSAKNPEELIANIDATEGAVRSLGHEAVSSLRRAEPEAVAGKAFDAPDKFGHLMKVEFDEIDKADALISVVQGPVIGTGQVMELSYAKGQGKPVVVVSHESADVNILSPLADHELTFTSADDLGRIVVSHLVEFDPKNTA